MTHPTGQVDIPGLRVIGDTVTESSTAFAKAHTAQPDAVRPGSTLTGWATGAALANADDVWSAFMKALAGQVRSFGASLTTAAGDYQATDDDAAARVRNAGAGTTSEPPARGSVPGQAPR